MIWQYISGCVKIFRNSNYVLDKTFSMITWPQIQHNGTRGLYYIHFIMLFTLVKEHSFVILATGNGKAIFEQIMHVLHQFPKLRIFLTVDCLTQQDCTSGQTARTNFQTPPPYINSLPHIQNGAFLIIFISASGIF